MVDETFLLDEDFDSFIIGGKKRKSCINEAMKRGKNKKQAKIECRTEMGGSAIGRGVKKATMVLPRGAFLLLLRLNYRGLSSRLQRAKESYPTDYARALRKWKFFGGEEKGLLKAINEGKNKKPLACGKNCKDKFDLKAKANSGFDGNTNYTEDEIAVLRVIEGAEYNNFFYPTGLEEIGAIILQALPIITPMVIAIAGVSMAKNEKEADEISAQSEAEAEEQAKQIEQERKRKNNIIIGSVIVATLLIIGGIVIFGNKKNK